MTIADDTTTTDEIATGAAPVPTIDLYRDIHKGIRNELFGTTLQAGSTDPADRAGRLDLAGRIDKLVYLLGSHARHEDTVVQPAIEAHVPAVAECVASDHEARLAFASYLGALVEVRIAFVEEGLDVQLRLAEVFAHRLRKAEEMERAAELLREDLLVQAEPPQRHASPQSFDTCRSRSQPSSTYSDTTRSLQLRS